MYSWRTQFIKLSHVLSYEKVINLYAKYKIGVFKMNAKNSSKKVPRRGEAGVFSNLLYESIKPKTVVREL